MTTLYTSDHEWLRIEGDVATIGITDYAQSQLGDVVFVELPKVGRSLKKAEAAAVVESVKAASDVYAPITGEVIEVNDALVAEPALVNSDAGGKAWFFKLKIADKGELGGLMDEAAYAQASRPEVICMMNAPLKPRQNEAATTFVRRHIGPSPRDVDAMLETVGAKSLRALMGETLPASIRQKAPLDLGRALERNRGAGAYERARRAEPGVHLADRPRLFRHDSAGGDPAQHPGKPGLVHGLHALPAGDQPGPAGSAVQLPDHDLRPHRARCRQRLAAR